MKTNWYRSAALAAAFCVSSSVLVFADQIKIGDPAPKFSVTSMSGKQMFFADMETGGPTFIYFIRNGDAVSQQETGYINKIIRAYGEARSTWYGIINAKEDQARSFQAESNPAFRLERDEGLSAIKMLGVSSAPMVMEFDGNGILMHTWKGYSAVHLKGINMAYAAASHKSMQDLDFSQAPSTAKYGTDFNSTTPASKAGDGR
jgi:peroxiredoxin